MEEIGDDEMGVEQAPDDGSGAVLTEPSPATAEDDLGTVLGRIEAAVDRGLADLRQAFDDRLAYDQAKEAQISRLHDEVQKHRQDLLGRAKRPLLNGLVRLHDDLGKVVGALEQRPEEELTPQRFFAALAGFADDLELLLAQHGVEPFRLPGDEFDPRRQTALRTEVTENPQKAGAIAARLRPGFVEGEALLYKERVAVYVAARRSTVQAAGIGGRAGDDRDSNVGQPEEGDS